MSCWSANSPIGACSASGCGRNRSKVKLCGDLNQAGSAGTHDLSEAGAGYVAIHRSRPVELSSIEDVEGLEPQFHRTGIGQPQTLVQCNIVIHHPWSGEEPAGGSAAVDPVGETRRRMC